MRALALVVGILVGCTQAPIPAPVNETVAYKADWNNPEWSAIVAKALDEVGSELLKAEPKDAAAFCKNFKSVDRKQFYIMLISGLARFESSFKPETTYIEDKKDAQGKAVTSRGLLQLSLESGNSYGCSLKKDQDLHDVETNLRCGVRILARWIPKDGVLRGGDSQSGWRGAARYWSPFRKDSRVSALKLLTASLPGCDHK